MARSQPHHAYIAFYPCFRIAILATTMALLCWSLLLNQPSAMDVVMPVHAHGCKVVHDHEACAYNK